MLDLIRPEVKSFYEKLPTDDDTLTLILRICVQKMNLRSRVLN